MQPKLALLGAAALLAAGLLFAGSKQLSRGEMVAGRARVIDGDSLRIDGHEIRLKGIDAPEGRQTCQKSGAGWACGEEARRELRQLVGSADVQCRVHGRDQHQRLLATCEASGRNVNQAMVDAGMAVAFGKFYNREEAAAREAKRGLWAGEFERPQVWRQRNNVGR
jgi:endonuclease YncB( thermonuclease family)